MGILDLDFHPPQLQQSKTPNNIRSVIREINCIKAVPLQVVEMRQERPMQRKQSMPKSVLGAQSSIPTKPLDKSRLQSKRVSMEFVSDEELLKHSNENAGGMLFLKANQLEAPQMEPIAKKSFFPPSPAFIQGSKASPTQQKIAFRKESAEFAEELFRGNAVQLMPSGLAKELVLVSSSQGSGDSNSGGALINSGQLSGSTGSQQINTKGVTFIAEKLSKRLPRNVKDQAINNSLHFLDTSLNGLFDSIRIKNGPLVH